MAQLSDDCFAFGGPMMSVDEAVRLIAARVTAVEEVETVPLANADGRIGLRIPHVVLRHSSDEENEDAIDIFLRSAVGAGSLLDETSKRSDHLYDQ